jgi:transposase
MTYFVGIDPASESLMASVFTTPDHPLIGPRQFTNDPEGIAALRDWLSEENVPEDPEDPEDQVLICVENTGVYSETLCYELHRLGLDLVLLDPHAVWKAFDEEPKTDALDSQRIAEYGYRYRDRLELWTPNEVVVEQVQTLLTTREQLVEQKTAAHNARQSLRRKPVQTPAANETLEETIAHLAAQIEALEQAIRDLIDEHPTMAQMVAIVTSAPGARLLLGAHMLVLTNGFTEEPQYRKLAAYLGICPNAHQSGKRKKTPTSRGYGPSMIRKLLHLAARSVRTHTDRFRAYFHRKRAEGKPKLLVFNNIANKLLRILCGMIKNKQPYIEDYQSIHPKRLQAGTRS